MRAGGRCAYVLSLEDEDGRVVASFSCRNRTEAPIARMVVRPLSDSEKCE